MWLGVPVLAGRVGRHRIMLTPREKERRLARSLNRVSGPAARRKRHVRRTASCCRTENRRQVRRETIHKRGRGRPGAASPSHAGNYGIRYRDVTDDGKLTISSRKIKIPIKTCLMFPDRDGNLTHLKFIHVNIRENRYVVRLLSSVDI